MPYAPTPHVLLEQDGPVAVITLNNPDERNALLDDMHEALREIWWHLAFDRTVRAAVITGAGSAFSAGGNIPTFIRDYDDAERQAKAFAKQTGADFISPYNDPDVIAGAATIALEIAEDAPATTDLVMRSS